MQGLLDLSRPTSQLSSLRPFQEKMEAYIIQSLGQGHECFGNLLIPFKLDKTSGGDQAEHDTRPWREWMVTSGTKESVKDGDQYNRLMSANTDYIWTFDNCIFPFKHKTNKKQEKFSAYTRSTYIPTPAMSFLQLKHFAIDCKTSLHLRREKPLFITRNCFYCLQTHCCFVSLKTPL
jgi:hypothetical protein